MRIETRGPERGPCNICGVDAKLTEDHIPPKGVPRVGQAYLMTLIDLLGAEQPRKSKRLFQNGVKFRSICARCNNEILGSRYDPDLVSLTQEIHCNNFHARLYLPVRLKARPNRVARAVVGHFLAHGINNHRTGEVANQLTDYLLDESALFPSDLRLYYWLYPYNDQVVINGAASILDYRSHKSPLFFMLLKFYPIAFMITKDSLPDSSPYSLQQLHTLLTSSINDEVTLEVSVAEIPHRRWPEAPGEHGLVLHGEGATAAVRTAP